MMKASKSVLAAVLAVAIITLAACGDGGSSTPPAPTIVATANLIAPASPAVVAAIVNTPYTFPAGVPEFGTTAATTLQFTSGGNTPTFSISSGGTTATGVTSFGSCNFTITGVSGVTGPLTVGRVIRVDPCQLNVATSGLAAIGSSTSRNTSLLLGRSNSNGVLLPFNINANGDVTIITPSGNNIFLGRITVAPVTGS